MVNNGRCSVNRTQFSLPTALVSRNVTAKGEDLLFIDITIDGCPYLHVCVCIFDITRVSSTSRSVSVVGYTLTVWIGVSSFRSVIAVPIMQD
jgi:hypothetical protein